MFVLLASLAAAASEPARPECAYDREAMLALDVMTFDQTEGKGWRKLDDADCFVEAAELLHDWQARHRGNAATPIERYMMSDALPWHEAQNWAWAGRTDLALPLFESTRKLGDSSNAEEWNLYIDGTLAFLRHDRPALEAAIAKMAAIPAPPGWGNARGVDGKPNSMLWPQNLGALQNLARCWGQPYLVAYECRDSQTWR